MDTYTVFYSAKQTTDGRFYYQFKLGDFGLAERYYTGLQSSRNPIPQSISSLHQNPRFSTYTYDREDDLYSIGYMMIELQSYLVYRGSHPCPKYQKLYNDFMIKSGYCYDVPGAIDVAEVEYRDMTLPIIH